jgi:two-component system NtrC family sensor kinase
MPRRLAQKLLLSLTIIVIIIEGVFGLINVRTQQRQLLDEMILGADQLSKGIVSATWHAMLLNHQQDAYQVMQTIALKQGIDRIRIFNRAGRLMFSTNPKDAQQSFDVRARTCSLCHATVPPKVRVDVPSRVNIVVGEDRRRNLEMVTPIYNEPACSQAACHAHPAETRKLGVLDVSLSLESVDREVANMKLRVFLVTGVQVLLISIFIFYFTRHFLGRPIRKLIDGTKAVSVTDLDKPIDIGRTSEELDELARSFNAMQERLRLAMAEINQFTQSLETKVEERTEQLKIAHQKLLQSDRLASLGTLAASVAHEINNPVSGVLNLAMLMQRILKEDGIPPERVPEFRKYLAYVASETARVGRIVSDLLAFSRRSKPQRALADLNRIVKRTLTLVSHKLQLMNVELELNLAQDVLEVSCDSSQIQQVVVDLVLNGAEATQNKGRGRISITTKRAPDGKAVALVVSDTGEGIRQENLKKIFDPFFTTKPEGKGVGLGLAVLYGIVEAHGGDIEVKSKVGEGTTFTVTLPVSQAEAPDTEAMIHAGVPRQ